MFGFSTKYGDWTVWMPGCGWYSCDTSWVTVSFANKMSVIFAASGLLELFERTFDIFPSDESLAVLQLRLIL